MSKNPRDYFDQSKIKVFDFEQVPMGEEVWLIDEQWMKELGPAIAANEGVFEIGYHTPAIVKRITADALEISVYITIPRYHELRVTLPRDQFVVAIDRPEYDITPRIFVTGAWLNDLLLRNHSVFAMFDVIGVKKALAMNTIKPQALITIRDRLDQIGDEWPSIAMVSFADSLLVKTNYTIGQYDSPIPHSYEPEKMIELFPLVRQVYRDILGLEVYAIITQGINHYADGKLIHTSRGHNHISLNSLGLPFAQLLAIDGAAHKAVWEKVHEPADLYMDKSFYHSLRFDRSRFDKTARPRYPYPSPMESEDSFYFAEKFEAISNALRAD